MRPSLACACLLAALAGCKDQAPPGCRVAGAQRLPQNALTMSRDVFLQPAGNNGFMIIGLDGDDVRWARIDGDGTMGPISTLEVPAPRAVRPEPWFAVVGKDAPGDQLVVAFVSMRGEVMVIAQDVGGTPSEPKKIADIAAGVQPSIVRIAMGSSRTGRRAALVLGYDGQAASPTVFVLKADAEVQPMPFPLYGRGAIPRWTCLSVVASRTDFAVSVIESERANNKPGWRIFELKDEGGRGFEYSMTFKNDKVDCPQVSPTPMGYVLVYGNENGIHFSEFNVDETVITSQIIAGALRFGGAHKIPRLACVAPMGREFGLLLERPGGHEVWRFDAFGRPKDSPLLLPASVGSVGSVSAIPGTDMFHATYLDLVPEGAGGARTDGNPTGNQRYFVKVDCPAAPPPFARVDAGGDTGK